MTWICCWLVPHILAAMSIAALVLYTSPWIFSPGHRILRDEHPVLHPFLGPTPSLPPPPPPRHMSASYIRTNPHFRDDSSLLLVTFRAKEDAARKQAAKDKKTATKQKQEVRVVVATACKHPHTVHARSTPWRPSGSWSMTPTLCRGVLRHGSASS